MQERMENTVRKDEGKIKERRDKWKGMKGSNYNQRKMKKEQKR